MIRLILIAPHCTFQLIEHILPFLIAWLTSILTTIVVIVQATATLSSISIMSSGVDSSDRVLSPIELELGRLAFKVLRAAFRLLLRWRPSVHQEQMVAIVLLLLVVMTRRRLLLVLFSYHDIIDLAYLTVVTRRTQPLLKALQQTAVFVELPPR